MADLHFLFYFIFYIYNRNWRHLVSQALIVAIITWIHTVDLLIYFDALLVLLPGQMFCTL